MIADDPGIRQDLKIARSLGVSLRRFWGWEATTWRSDDGGKTVREAEYDEWERALWRAFDNWEQGRCPGCGEPFAESIWDRKDDSRAKYRAGYHQCNACLALENAQIKQSNLDDELRKSRGKNADPIPTRHRHWFVERNDEKGR